MTELYSDEWLCEHSVGHPYEDRPHHGGGIHGCDGCCGTHRHSWVYKPETQHDECGCGDDAQYVCKSQIKIMYGRNGVKLKRPKYIKCLASMSVYDVEAILDDRQ